MKSLVLSDVQRRNRPGNSVEKALFLARKIGRRNLQDENRRQVADARWLYCELRNQLSGLFPSARLTCVVRIIKEQAGCCRRIAGGS